MLYKEMKLGHLRNACRRRRYSG